MSSIIADRVALTLLLSDRLPQSNIPTKPLSRYPPPTREDIPPDGPTITGPIDQSIAQGGISPRYVRLDDP